LLIVLLFNAYCTPLPNHAICIDNKAVVVDVDIRSRIDVQNRLLLSPY